MIYLIFENQVLLHKDQEILHIALVGWLVGCDGEYCGKEY